MSERPTTITFRTDLGAPGPGFRWTQMVPGEAVVHEYEGEHAGHRCLIRALYVCCPGGKEDGAEDFHLGSTGNHDHQWHEDGTVTVLPSILCGCGAHYFIRQNRIDYV